jgi:hypothetical protein
MLFEFYSPSECFLADAALVRFLPSVDEAMLFEFYSLSECFPADAALVIFLCSVNQAIVFEFYRPNHCFPADAALVRFLPRVDEAVLLQVMMLRFILMCFYSSMLSILLQTTSPIETFGNFTLFTRYGVAVIFKAACMYVCLYFLFCYKESIVYIIQYIYIFCGN